MMSSHWPLVIPSTQDVPEGSGSFRGSLLSEAIAHRTEAASEERNISRRKMVGGNQSLSGPRSYGVGPIWSIDESKLRQPFSTPLEQLCFYRAPRCADAQVTRRGATVRCGCHHAIHHM